MEFFVFFIVLLFVGFVFAVKDYRIGKDVEKESSERSKYYKRIHKEQMRQLWIEYPNMRNKSR